ncbi:Alpha/beta hydrolase fold [Quillaja saponaria]|uniref:Alpha/beta hydrolase fold n=1 Tax=Quillaja saponaria TaxID=32244 RepID=A0AAD7VJY7_QUISA|nr:Alpha/beta hydrolase fold [Quillaja saponaria]
MVMKLNSIAILKPIVKWFMKKAGFRPQTIEIEPGTIMHFWVPIETSNNKHKPCVVLIHGFAFTGILTWTFQALSLAKNYAVYVPDLIFFGESTSDRPDRLPEFQAECVAKGLMKLGVENCTLVGFSYGGTLVFKIADTYPNMVDSMIISSSTIALTESISKAALERVGFSSWSDYLLPSNVKEVKLTFDIATYKFPPIPNFLWKDILELFSENRKEKKEFLEALVVSDTDYSIQRKYPQKLHLLWGEHDRIFTVEVANNIKKQLGENVEVHCIEKAGHLLQLERPFTYNKHLHKILASFMDDDKEK